MKNVLICWACSLAVICIYSFRQGQKHTTSLQLMQLQFYGHVYRHLFLLDGTVAAAISRPCVSGTFSFWMELWWVGFFLFLTLFFNNIWIITYFFKLPLLTTPCNLTQQNHYAKPVQSQRAQSSQSGQCSQPLIACPTERQLRIEWLVTARVKPPSSNDLRPSASRPGRQSCKWRCMVVVWCLRASPIRLFELAIWLPDSDVEREEAGKQVATDCFIAYLARFPKELRSLMCWASLLLCSGSYFLFCFGATSAGEVADPLGTPSEQAQCIW